VQNIFEGENMELTGFITEENLKRTFDIDPRAVTQYQLFAESARSEGFELIARITFFTIIVFSYIINDVINLTKLNYKGDFFWLVIYLLI
jgi:hypothetical protein